MESHPKFSFQSKQITDSDITQKNFCKYYNVGFCKYRDEFRFQHNKAKCQNSQLQPWVRGGQVYSKTKDGASLESAEEEVDQSASTLGQRRSGLLQDRRQNGYSKTEVGAWAGTPLMSLSILGYF